MQYEELSILLDATPSGECTVRVVRSPDGGTTGAVPLALDLDGALSELAAGFERQARAGCEDTTALAGGEAAVRALGRTLAAALLTQQIRDRFLAALDAAPRGLRIRFQTALESAAAARLAALPWEALARPSPDERPLGLDRHTALVRAVDLPISCRPLPFEGPLRILVVAAAPRDQARLDLMTEIQKLKEAFPRRRATVTVLPRADLAELRCTLLAGAFHILHFMGHGETDPTTGQGRLLFESEDGGSQPIDGEDLATHLHAAPSLRLVFLNACRTAGAAASAPFATVAAALLRAGIPAVVAMQLPVSDRAAVEFSSETYRRLAAGDPLEAAVAEGRLAIRRACPGSGEWVTPVLFLRAADGRILEPRRDVRRLLVGLAGTLLLVVLGGSAAHWFAAGIRATQAARPLALARTQPEIHTLHDGSAIWITGWMARLHVQFWDKNSYPGFGDQVVVTVSLTPRGGETQRKAVSAASTDLEFVVDGKTRHVTAEHIDERTRAVRLSLY